MKLENNVLELSRKSSLINCVITKDSTIIEIPFEEIEQMIDSLQNGKIVELKNQNLKKIYNKNTSANLECGVNGLNLAIGFVRWHDRDKNELFSPILLYPVKLNKVKKIKGEEYFLESADEEIHYNASLFVKMKNELNIDFKKMDEAGNDFEVLLNEAKLFFKKYDLKILEEVKLGLFYNPRLNMYYDLKNTKDLINNHTFIKALNGDQSEIEPLSKMKSQFQYQIPMVVDCDSSQYEAITHVLDGKNLIIEGPPGTGKSQTITNIIGNLLYNNKKVLFVASKKAALDVVYRNLKRVALDDACLYLDSHKVNRKQVFNELYETVTNKHISYNCDGDVTLNDLINDNKYFQKYTDILNVKFNNMSLLKIIDKYLELQDVEDCDNYIENIKGISVKELNCRIKFLKLYQKYMDRLGTDSIENHLYYGFKTTELSIGTKNSIEKCIKKILSITLFEDFDCLKKYPVKYLKDFLDIIIRKPKYIDDKWTIKKDFLVICKQVERLENLQSKINCLKDDLASIIKFENINLSDFSEIELNEIDNFKKRKKIIKKVKKALISYLLDKKYKLDEETVIKIISMFNLNKEFSKLKDDYSFDDLTDVKKDIEVFKMLFSLVPSDISIIDNPFKNTNLIEKQRLEYIMSDISGYLDLIKYINGFYDSKVYNFFDMSMEQINNKIANYNKQINTFNLYITLTIEISHYEKDNLMKFISDNIHKNSLDLIYLKNYYVKVIDNCLNELNNFNVIEYENKLDEFIIKDEIYKQISIAKIRSKISSIRPQSTNTSLKSDIGIIKTQMESPTMSIRGLFKKIEKTLQRIKPVMLMSPLTVSTYLPSTLQFDTVIFDEASQILTNDAICAIYRAKQVVVVGDSKQLPPTDFFRKTILEEDFIDENSFNINNLSLLDVCHTFLDSIKLKWHYRSKCENLIAFSNNAFYGDELITFPEVRGKDNDYGVEYIQVDNALYSRGDKRTNEVEAERIVDSIIDNILNYPMRSMGVISFSIVQMNQIETCLEKRLTKLKNDDYNKYIQIKNYIDNEDTDEPFFIKNLENVQGDERDTILLSIGYGYSEDNKLSMSLGKLSQEEGQKRINVAITRSKVNMKVFCSFDPEEIRVNTTNQQGLEILKKFLLFAKDNSTLINKTYDEANKNLALSIANHLYHRGYDCDINVGHSLLKVDVSVNINNHKTAILLDTINKNLSVRDIYIARSKVLKSLGWKVINITTLEYLKDPIQTIKKIEDFLESLPKKDSKLKISYKDFEEEINKSDLDNSCYEICDVISVYNEHNQELYNNQFINLLTSIIEIEGPIHITDIAKKMYWFFGANEYNLKVEEIIESRINELGLSRKFNYDNGFYYSKDKKDFQFRESESIRPLEYVYFLEISDLIYKIIKTSSGVTLKELYSDVCRYTHNDVNNKTNSAISTFYHAFQYLLIKELIELKDDLMYVRQ